MTPWRTYADPPYADPQLAAAERHERARALRREVGFHDALRSGGTGIVVWACADGLDAVVGPAGVILDAAHIDDALPGPWERDLLDLARQRALTGRAAEALAEGYQQGVAAVADIPLHATRDEARRRSRRLAEHVDPAAAQSAPTAVRRLVSRDARLRPDRLIPRWGCDVAVMADPSAEVAQYRESLPEPAARMLSQYRVADAVAGAGGQLMVLLSRGTDVDDVILLEAMPAHQSTREVSMGAWREGSDVHRVLLAREAVPLVPAEFSGWSTSSDGSVARVWSRARSADEGRRRTGGARPLGDLGPDLGGRRAGARRWGAALGLLHASSSDAVSLAGYIGRSRKFPAAVRDVVNEDGA